MLLLPAERGAEGMAALTEVEGGSAAVREGGREPRRHHIALPDGRSASAVEWAGAGVPVVLLHGLLDSGLGWQDLCARTSRHCLAVDLAGFSALVLLAPAGFGRILLAEAVSLPLVRHFTERTLPAVLANRAAIASAYRLFVTGGAAVPDELLDRLQADARTLTPAAREATKAVVRAGLSREAFHRRSVGYGGSVVVLWGDCDAVVPHVHAAGVLRALPQSDRLVSRGMGHHPQRERGQELLELVERVAAAVVAPVRPLPLAA